MERKPTIGASQVAAILGVSPWVDPVEVWGRLTGRLPEQPDSLAMRRGRIMEPGLRRLAGELVGAEVRPGPGYAEPGWPVGDIGHARPDGWHLDGSGLVLHELKTTGRLSDWPEDEPPVYYLTQLLWQLAATPPGGMAPAHADILTAYDVESGEVRQYRVTRDEGTERRIARLRVTVEAWYERHILGDRCPDGVSAEARALAGALTPPSGEWLEPTEADRDLVARWTAARESARAATQAADALAAEVKARIGSAEGLRGLVRAGKAQTRTTLDTSIIYREAPELAARAERTSAPWRTLYPVKSKE